MKSFAEVRRNLNEEGIILLFPLLLMIEMCVWIVLNSLFSAAQFKMFSFADLWVAVKTTVLIIDFAPRLIAVKLLGFNPDIITNPSIWEHVVGWAALCLTVMCVRALFQRLEHSLLEA